ANPAIISQYPEESKKVIKSLVKYCSGGIVLALGCETFDKTVCAINNLNSFPEQSFDAIKIINEIGNVISENGMPKLLPGINLLFGLAGETGDTWKCNYDFLSKILDSNLLLRRINIRQAIKFDGSYISEISSKPSPKLKYEFEQYKKMIRKDIDNEMLKKIAPVGRVLKNLFIEKKDKYLSFARQFGAYPIIVGTAENLEFEKFFDMIIVNHGYRSVTGLLYPVNINTIKYESLKTISGVNKDIANRIIYKRPFSDINDFFKNIPEHITPVFNSLTEHITFNKNQNFGFC
ncbi:MAG TPA: helix-hairpin-helix domain-containing protein, partial [bacterium]|nr:helix-hairpin-helix domain-containing protein [bacterium]